MVKVTILHLFSFPRYQTKCVIRFLFRQLMMSLQGEKKGEDGNTKIWISRERKGSLFWFCLNQGRLVRLGQEGVAWGWGKLCKIPLKGVEQKRREENIFKRGGGEGGG